MKRRTVDASSRPCESTGAGIARSRVGVRIPAGFLRSPSREGACRPMPTGSAGREFPVRWVLASPPRWHHTPQASDVACSRPAEVAPHDTQPPLLSSVRVQAHSPQPASRFAVARTASAPREPLPVVLCASGGSTRGGGRRECSSRARAHAGRDAGSSGWGVRESTLSARCTQARRGSNGPDREAESTGGYENEKGQVSMPCE